MCSGLVVGASGYGRRHCAPYDQTVHTLSLTCQRGTQINHISKAFVLENSTIPLWVGGWGLGEGSVG